MRRPVANGRLEDSVMFEFLGVALAISFVVTLFVRGFLRGASADERED